MDIKLPNRSNSQKADVLRDVRQLTLIGANGSGKSRFCSKLMEQGGDAVYRISALRAMFPSEEKNPLKGSIGAMFEKLNGKSAEVKIYAESDFDKLFHIMLHDELRVLMNYKARLLMGENPEFPKTKLDVTVKAWQEVFPKNKVLRENGKLMFSTEGQDDTYTSLRLSDGEKAVLFYIGAVQYAMPDAMIVVDDPESFIHPSIMVTLWNEIEALRPDCTFVYNTHDVNFASTRTDNTCVWVKSFDPSNETWDYEVMDTSRQLSDALYFDLLGSRKPILFIEGDEIHSIDSRLYPLIFPEYMVKPLGSCNKVIESVRSFNDLAAFHHMDSWGIVDRDRRDDVEVEYLRKKKVMVPNVAEIENLLLLEGVVKAVARQRHRNPDDVFNSVKHTVMKMFAAELKQQALMHVRHRVKHDVEVRIDRKFRNINALEEHMIDLVNEIDPRSMYETLCRQFHQYVSEGNYAMVLQVFNQKMILGDSNVAALCGLAKKEDYIKQVLHILKGGGREAKAIRAAVKECFGVTDELMKQGRTEVSSFNP